MLPSGWERCFILLQSGASGSGADGSLGAAVAAAAAAAAVVLTCKYAHVHTFARVYVSTCVCMNK